MYPKYGKRLFDLAFALPAMLLLLPLLLFIALLVRLLLGSPVLYRQARPGLFESPFDLYKFRTMTDAVDAEGRLLPDEQRLTSFGRLLRNTSLDELPEFFNILNGEMSLVGPRPLLMEYLPRYTQEQARRHHVPPGLTGWAQVNGRNDLSWNEKFELDVWYVDNVSFWTDLRILWQTIWVVLDRRGVNQPGHATASTFTGSMIRNDKPSS